MAELEPPKRRECQQCGRREEWDSDATSWTIADDADAGDPFCIHEWDITGSYHPIRD